MKNLVMKERYGLLSAALLLVLSIAAISPQATLAATTTVGTASELIAAITSANSNPDADTIILTANITLMDVGEISTNYGDSGLPAITSTITIEGQGYSITRDVSAPNFRIVRVASNGNLTVVNTVMSNGSLHKSGGAIFSTGVLTIMNSTFSYNSAVSGQDMLQAGGGAISGSPTIINSTFSDNTADSGGAISGSATIINSIFSGNHAIVWGGAIYTAGGTSINNSTFSNNSIGDSANSNGGAIYDSFGVVTITNSTFFGNSTGYVTGAIYEFSASGTVTITNSTIVGNTAAMNGGVLIPHGTVSYSTIAGNSSPNTANGFYGFNANTNVNSSIIAANPNGNCGGTFSSSFSLADDDTCSGFTNSPTINLATLADNGSSTGTVALNVGSSALDAGDPTNCPATDQRGVARGIDANGIANNPVTGDCDVGAFESGGIIRTLQFTAPASYIMSGTITTVPVELTLDGPLPAKYGPITAYLWIAGGTAQVGTDYSPFGMQTVVFNPGDQTKTVNVQLLNPALTSDHTIILSFGTQNGPGFSGPARLGTQLMHTITLKAAEPTLAPSITPSLEPTLAVTSIPHVAPLRNYFTTRTPTLTWTLISQAIRYEIQAAKNATFSGATIYHVGNNLSFTWPVELANGTYHWHVRACKSVPETSCGPWSASDTFMVFVP